MVLRSERTRACVLRGLNPCCDSGQDLGFLGVIEEGVVEGLEGYICFAKAEFQCSSPTGTIDPLDCVEDLGNQANNRIGDNIGRYVLGQNLK